MSENKQRSEQPREPVWPITIENVAPIQVGLEFYVGVKVKNEFNDVVTMLLPGEEVPWICDVMGQAAVEVQRLSRERFAGLK